MKSPEEYLQEQVLLPEQAAESRDVSTLEQEFIRGFLLPETQELAEQKPHALQEFASCSQESYKASQAQASPAQDEFQLQQLKTSKQVEFVGFALLRQEFALPIVHVQEVIRSVSSTKLPSGPEFLAGVINLRGKVTPLIDMARLLGLEGLSPEKCGFIIVCRQQDLQFGLLVQRITTMHKARQESIEWDVQSHLVEDTELIAGLIKLDGYLAGIVSIAALVRRALSQSW
ncbi:MAG: chemotaxis protein CheW [Desulfohalobiaceae bacterium]